MSEPRKSIRLATPARGDLPAGYDRARLCYWWDDGYGAWLLNVPGGGLANLKGHVVTVHEDGTITASPSVAIYGGPGPVPIMQAHGYLERGMWRDV